MKVRNRKTRLVLVTSNSLTVNPFVSEAQRRACYAKDDPAWDCSEWESKTKEQGKKIPARKRKKPTTNKATSKITTRKKRARRSAAIPNPVNPLRIDPTRTTTLRRFFIGKLRQQFARLKGQIVKLVEVEDAFGIKEREPLSFNVFCPTGSGGGVDATCSPSSSGGKEKHFSTVFEAEKHLKDSHIADSVNLQGLYPEEASAVVGALKASLSVGGHDLKLRSVQVVDHLPVGKDEGGLGYSNGNIYITKGFIAQAREHDEEKVRKSLEGTGGERNTIWQSAKTPSEAIAIAVAHEAGHHVDFAMSLDIGKGVRETRDNGHTLGEKEMVAVSGYASTHNVELFAEVHAMVSMGKGHTLSKPIQEFYKRTLATADSEPFQVFVRNIFCPTGEGGGVDATCSPGGSISSLPRVREKARLLIEKTRQDGIEHGAVFDDKGIQLWEGSGADAALPIPEEIAKDPKNVIIHTHPTESSFTAGDWIAHLKDPVSEFTAESPSTSYVLRVKEGTKGTIAEKMKGLSSEDIEKQWWGFAREGAKKLKDVSPRQRAEKATRYASQKMADHWGFDYRESLHSPPVENVFCPTGPGGGVDATCSPSSGGSPAEHGGGDSLTGVIAPDLIEGLKAAGATAAHLEHIASSYVSDKVASAVSKLPLPMQKVVNAAYVVGKVGVQSLFVTWKIKQALAERVAQERGATPEQARRLRGVLSGIDLKTFEVFKFGTIGGIHAAHIPAIVTGTLPVATTAYLAYSTARNPLATARAAGKMVKEGLGHILRATAAPALPAGHPLAVNVGKIPGLTKVMKGHYQYLHPSGKKFILLRQEEGKKAWNVHEQNGPTAYHAGPPLDSGSSLEEAIRLTGPGNHFDQPRDELGRFAANELTENADYDVVLSFHDALAAHDYDDWYIALLSASLDEGKNLHGALALASYLYEESPSPSISLTANTRWQFSSDPEKIRAFQKWLKEQMQSTVRGQTEEALWNKYIEDGFKKGAGRAFDDTRRLKRPELYTEENQQSLRDFYAGTKDEFLKSAFGQPVAKEKVELLAGRSFDDLEGITDDMSLKMSRALADGLVQGKSPHDIARDLAEQVDITRQRAEVIARTEIIRAHAEGQLTAMEQLGIEEVGVAVEWSTTGDEKVCKLCQPLEGIVLKIDEARGLLPRHPNCRCAWVPANVGEDSEDQKDSKREIQDAIKDSIEEGGGEDWAGEDADIDKDRPESIFNVAYDPSLLEFSSFLANMNPNHDEQGRFTEGEGGSGPHEVLAARVKEAYQKLYGPNRLKPGKERKALEKQFREDLKQLESHKAQVGKGVSSVSVSPPVAPSPSAPSSQISHVATAQEVSYLASQVSRIDKETSSHNFVHLGDLRAAHPDWSREKFDSVIQKARSEGKVSLSGAEGRHGISEKDREVAIHEPGLTEGHTRPLLYASLTE